MTDFGKESCGKWAGHHASIKVYTGAMTHDVCMTCVVNISVIFVELIYEVVDDCEVVGRSFLCLRSLFGRFFLCVGGSGVGFLNFDFFKFEFYVVK